MHEGCLALMSVSLTTLHSDCDNKMRARNEECYIDKYYQMIVAAIKNSYGGRMGIRKHPYWCALCTGKHFKG